MCSPFSEVPPDFPVLRPSEVLSRANSNATTLSLTNGASSPPSPKLNANGLVTAQPQNGVDAVWQVALQHLLSSPTQFQRLMQSIANQQHLPTAPPADPTPVPPQPSQQVTTYDPNQANLWFNLTASPNLPSASSALLPPPLLAHTDDGTGGELALPPLLENSGTLEKGYRDAAEIDADMDRLQSTIDSLIQNLGMDPSAIPSAAGDDHVPAHSATADGHDGAQSFEPMDLSDGLHHGGHDDLLDSLLMQISDPTCVPALDYPDITDHYDPSTRIGNGTTVADASPEQLAAFLDDTASEASAKSPMLNPQKRKSDVIEYTLPATSEVSVGRKIKRKR